MAMITIETQLGDKYELPVSHRRYIHNRFAREENCLDVLLVRNIDHTVPLQTKISVRTDGSLVLVSTEWTQSDNTYWHVYDSPTKWINGTEHKAALTAAQEHTIAMMWANRIDQIKSIDPAIPKTLLRGVGSTPQRLLSSSVVDILQASQLPVPAIN